MPEPLALPSATPRHELPFLFTAQAQKEAFINEAFVRIDILLHPTFIAELAAPPENPEVGSTYLVASDATGAWEGKTGALAAWTIGGWVFVAPRPGMIVRDVASGQMLVHDDGWRGATAPPAPSGGETIDTECRAALSFLLDAMRSIGVIS
ncbi:MAG: DUF2793 domain-containing protein [Erythrobacter sp.]|nr:DUF2793 domain-containing protein [Erythrobacter sp.]